MAELNKFQKQLNEYMAKGDSASGYTAAINWIGGMEKNYVNAHYAELKAETTDRAQGGIADGVTLYDMVSLFKHGININAPIHINNEHVSDFESIGMQREALVQLQKKGVPYNQIIETNKLYPDMDFVKMRENYLKTGTLDANGHDRYATETRRKQAFENKVSEVWAKHPDAEVIASLSTMIEGGKIKEGVSPHNVSKVKHSADKHKTTPDATAKQESQEGKFANSEQAFPADLARVALPVKPNSPELLNLNKGGETFLGK